MHAMFKDLTIEQAPFAPIANEYIHEDEYVGRVTDGIVKGFNVFKGLHGYYIVIFGRTQKITVAG